MMARLHASANRPMPHRNKAVTMSRHAAHLDQPAGAWVNFSYIAFEVCLLMVVRPEKLPSAGRS